MAQLYAAPAEWRLAARRNDVDRALARLSKATARTAGEMATLYACADVLPVPIRTQLSNAVEELDLLQYMLREATLSMAIRGSPGYDDAA
jgi:hypothetical protein